MSRTIGFCHLSHWNHTHRSKITLSVACWAFAVTGQALVNDRRMNRVLRVSTWVWKDSWAAVLVQNTTRSKHENNKQAYVQYCLRQDFHAAFAALLSCHNWESLSLDPAACTAWSNIAGAQSFLGLPRFLGPTGKFSSKPPGLKTVFRNMSESLRKAKRCIKSSCLRKSVINTQILTACLI